MTRRSQALPRSSDRPDRADGRGATHSGPVRGVRAPPEASTSTCSLSSAAQGTGRARPRSAAASQPWLLGGCEPNVAESAASAGGFIIDSFFERVARRCSFAAGAREWN